ncbi:hypothetical protein [Nostoc sp. DSM 114159]
MVKVIFSLACVGVARTTLGDALASLLPRSGTTSDFGCAVVERSRNSVQVSDHRRHRFLNILHPDYKLHANYFQSPEKYFQLDRPLVLLHT